MKKKTLPWESVVDYYLIEIGRNLSSYADNIYPPSLKTVTLAITLAQDLDYYQAPPPHNVYVDHYGGLVFEREIGPKRVVVTILDNGSVEYLGLGFQGSARRKVIPKCKTGEEDYWSKWIKEAVAK